MNTATPKPGMWSTLRSMFRCALVIVAVAAVGLGVLGKSLWSQADQLLRSELERQIAERVPGWDLSFSSAKANLDGTVRVVDVLLQDRNGDPIVEIPEIILQIDTELLFRHQKVLVHAVRVHDPLMRIHCDSGGHWNIDLPRPRPSGNAPPDVSVRNARVLVQLDESARWPTAEFRVGGLNLRAAPQSRHGYSVVAKANVEHVGSVEATATSDFSNGIWRASGRCDRVNLEGLLKNLVGVSPVARERVSQIAEVGRNARRPRPVQLASLDGDSRLNQPAEPATRASDGLLSEIGLQADMSVEFSAGAAGRGSLPTYSLTADIRDGQLTNRVLPIPLFGLKGKVSVDNDRVTVDSLTASHGDSRFLIDGQWDFRGEAPHRRFVGQATELRLGPELEDYLPEPLARRFRQLNPAGRFNLNVEYDAALGAIPLKLKEFTVADGSLRHEMFPVPVSQIQGSIRQVGSRFELSFKGQANGRNVALEGAVDGLTPDANVRLGIHVDELPVDAMFLEAFKNSANDKVQKLSSVLESLHPAGIANWNVSLERPAGPGQKFQLHSVHGNVIRGSMEYARFPYRITDLSGVLQFEQFVDNTWHFRDLRGMHGTTQITGDGSFAVQPVPGFLMLQLTALGVPIDADLQTATTTATKGFETVWEELSPTGTLDLTNIRIGWSPGAPVEVILPSIQFRDASITPAALPYRWERLNGAARWADGRLVIHTLQGWHRYGSIIEASDDSTNAYLNINGVDPAGDEKQSLAYFEQLGEGAPGTEKWRLHLADVQIRRLAIDDELRGALPTSLRTVAANLAPTRPLDVEFGLDLKGFGTRNDAVTASWRVRRGVFSGGDVNLGIPVQNVRGFFEMTEGSYNGKTVSTAGYVQLDEATIYSLPFKQVRGPFRVVGNQIFVGSPNWIEVPATQRPSQYAGQPVEGQLYGGVIQVNASAEMIPTNPEASRYTAEVELADARLSEWAYANQPGMQLSGEVSGNVFLNGEGSDPTKINGDGFIQIAKAQLFGLPFLVKVFQPILGQEPENTAFNRARGEFKLHDGLFDFSRIEFVGTTIELLGRGTIGFAGESEQTVDIKLYTRVKNNLPIFGPIVELVQRGWMGFQITGTVSQPTVIQQARIPILEDALKGFQRALDQGQPMRPSRRSGR